MKAPDVTKVNLITAAIQGAVANLDTAIAETDTEIILTTRLMKSAVIGRPKKAQLPLPTSDTDTAGGQG